MSGCFIYTYIHMYVYTHNTHPDTNFLFQGWFWVAYGDSVVVWYAYPKPPYSTIVYMYYIYFLGGDEMGGERLLRARAGGKRHWKVIFAFWQSFWCVCAGATPCNVAYIYMFSYIAARLSWWVILVIYMFVRVCVCVVRWLYNGKIRFNI